VITYKLPKVDCFGLPVEDGAPVTPVPIADLTATLPTISITAAADAAAAAAAAATATAGAVVTAVTPASGGPPSAPPAV